jgi:hypothetical protein
MNSVNLYADSWKLYKTHSDFFKYDFEYYYELCKNKKTLEAFAGYGRLTNFLQSKGINIHANELSRDLANFIELPSSKVNIGDFLTFQPEEKFERIIIAYNSFCLMKEESSARAMFKKIEELLVSNGIASLSYYHPNNWVDPNTYEFKFEGETVSYRSKCDLSKRSEKKGIWEDLYYYRGLEFSHQYDLRIYENRQDLEALISDTKLQIIGEIRNYNNSEIAEEGWTEYLLQLP